MANDQVIELSQQPGQPQDVWDVFVFFFVAFFGGAKWQNFKKRVVDSSKGRGWNTYIKGSSYF